MTPKNNRSAGAQGQGRYAYHGLEREIHEKARLGIMTSLVASRDGVSFSDLKRLCALTDGNLSRHLAVLSEAGFVEINKSGRGKNSQTVCRITKRGRQRFMKYLQEIERIIADAAEADVASDAPDNPSLGWSS